MSLAETTLQKNLVALLLVAIPLTAMPAGDHNTGEHDYPLLVHMKHWLRGSGRWRAPNPAFDAAYDGPPASASIEYFGVNWVWEARLKLMRGELTGVLADGTEVPLWAMFAFFNPVTEQVIFQQVGRNGTYITGSGPVRKRYLEFGQLEVQVATEYAADGTTKEVKHENRFRPDGCHDSVAFERRDGEWKEQARWTWCLTSLEATE